MQIKSKLVLALPITLVALFGCSSGKDLFEPVEAPVVVNQINVDELWSRSFSGSKNFYSDLVEAYSEGKLFTATRSGDVYALDAASGKTLWNYDLSDEEENDEKRSARLSSGITVKSNMLAVGSENGFIYILDKNEGNLIWKTYVGGEIIAKAAFSRSGNKVFVYDQRGRVSALDTIDGKILWSVGDDVASLNLRGKSAPLAIGDDYVIVGNSDGKVKILAQSTGSTVNQIDVTLKVGRNELERISDVIAKPLIIDHNLYAVAYSGPLIKYSFDSYTKLATLAYNSTKDMDYDSENLVIVDNNSHVFCVSLDDNHEIWHNLSLTNRKLTAPVIYGDYVVVGDLEGFIYFISLQDGSLVYKEEIEDETPINSVVAANGNLFVKTSDGDLSCLSYPQNGLTLSKEEQKLEHELLLGMDLNVALPGVGDQGGIYAPDSISYKELVARREAIIKAVRANEQAIARAQAKAKAERERYIKEQEEAREAQRKRLSGFGIAPGVSSEE